MPSTEPYEISIAKWVSNSVLPLDGTFTMALSKPNESCELFEANCRFIQNTSATPLVPVELSKGRGRIWCKLEFLNPSGSTKDRIAKYILEKQWRLGRLRRGDTVIEASSGSTSIALALA
jgi:cysteine synthase A